MISDVIVFVYLPGEIEAVPAGTLRITQVGQDIYSKFVYGDRYMGRPNAIELDPVSLSLPRKLREEITPVNQLPLFGAFRDATPDAWGRRVIEKRAGTSAEMPEVDYMLGSSDDRVGALDFRRTPTDGPKHHFYNKVLDLGRLLECADRIEMEQDVPEEVLQLLLHGSSLGGARPKAVVEDDDGLWLAKFNSKSDRFNYATIELATMKMATECGIAVPKMKVLNLPQGSVFMSGRFDRERNPNGYARKHFVSALTMLGKDETESHLSSYADICATIAKQARGSDNKEMKTELFRRMAFNIMVGNTDDHLRNHGFLREHDGYVLSPAYDVVPAPRHGSERFQHLSVGVHGKQSTPENAVSGCGVFGLTKAEAGYIVAGMESIVAGWRELYAGYGVSQRDIDAVESAFRKPVFPDDDNEWKPSGPGSAR
jgi:serine/threonine-protein kinase HipA